MFNSKYLPRAIKVLHSNIYPKAGRGSWIYNYNNDKYLDFTSGIGALSTGHNHPYVLESVKKQLNRYVHMPQQVFNIHKASNSLTEKMLDILPNKSMNSIFYVNSGSEATDNAIKIARSFTKKQNIITITRGFHGRTYGALSITSSNLSCKTQTHPFIPGVYFCNPNDIDHFNEILENQTSPDDVACIIYEPIQGEGGIFSLDSQFLQDIHAVSKKHNILTIADEVQCGFGRSGVTWNIQNKKVIPDILTFGKGIASGFPLAGLATRREITDVIGTNFLGGTYGGNAICCAAAAATLDVFENENIIDNVNIKGTILKNRLETMPYITKIRQYGLMIGLETQFSNNPALISKFIQELNTVNVLVLSCGNNGQYIRLLPPLNVLNEDCDFFLDRFEHVLSKFIF